MLETNSFAHRQIDAAELSVLHRLAKLLVRRRQRRRLIVERALRCRHRYRFETVMDMTKGINDDGWVIVLLARHKTARCCILISSANAKR